MKNKLQFIVLAFIASVMIYGTMCLVLGTDEPVYTKYKIVDRIEKTSQSIFGTSYLYYVTYDTGDGLETSQVDYNVYYNDEYYTVKSFE